ncbi:MAG: hypothetical protein IPL57_13295 [Rubrivivax sp.]|nr:hypothetical protein [Rubrivivax sp.]
MQLTIATASTLLASILCCACAPLPMRVYVADAAQSDLIYSSCSFNTHIPIAVKLHAGPVLATLSLSKNDDRPYVQLQLDIPEGVTLVFQDDVVQLRTGSPDTLSRARFPSVSLVDTPILNNYRTETQSYQVPVQSPLVGGRLQMGAKTSPRHFWLATYVEIASANEVTVALPSFRVNEVSSVLAPVRFRAKTVLGVALVNC